MAVALHDKSSSVDVRRFRDPLYSYMTFGQRVCSIIDTKHFQRLRRVKQLGTTYYVWPTACHNRFEHCLGVAHLAQTLAEQLQKSQPELGITDEEVDCVAIAGLCHDLGHGPWSHVWDGLFIPQAIPGSKWQHEHASEMMFDDLVQEYAINISEDEITFVKALIAGDPTRCKFEVKPYLFEIVANKRNGLDVDKFDYIARDSQAVGGPNISELTRLIYSARVIDDQICYNIKDVNQVYQVCYTRFSLHKDIYNHKTAKAIEYMIIDGLLAAEPVMKIAERIKDPKLFIHLSDNIKDTIEETTDPRLEAARDIFARIASRDLYKMVDCNIIPWDQQKLFKEQFTPERIVKAVKEYKFTPEDNVKPEDIAALGVGDVIVDLSPMHYGMKDKNPLESVKFYSKRSPNVSEHAGPSDISLILPATFGEVLLRVFTRKRSCYGLVQTGYRELLKQLSDAPETTTATATTATTANTFSSKPKPGRRPSISLVDSDEDVDTDLNDTPPQGGAGGPRFPSSAAQAQMNKRKLGRAVSAPSHIFGGSSTPAFLGANRFTTVPKNFGKGEGQVRASKRAKTDADV
ncbi:hypothetical protein BXZ70DRAFT_887582 [Cristinia sonorae]|uniref:HD domain-containing protein n=1 Tax=Cristinia sonorae TaxID=1940300 RepID=A0A8K0XTD1_9AGAR|nr:hypothetical protein BXZ70DRAFT_887582 [Cristinia sonorae]